MSSKLSWKTNRKTRGIFRVQHKDVMDAIRRIGRLDSGLRDVRVDLTDGRTETEYGTRTTPTIIYLNRNEKNPALALEHEIGHIAEDRMPRAWKREWEEEWAKNDIFSALKNADGTWDQDRYYIAFGEPGNKNSAEEETFAEMFAAQTFGWQNTRFKKDPSVLFPKLWAFSRRIWKDANRRD